MQAANKKIIGTFWLVCASLCISISWLIPNHYVPWVTFHTDATMAISLTFVAAWIVWSTRREKWKWHWPAILVAALVAIPILQFFGNMIPFFGAAWINSAFLVGLLFSMLIGAQWEEVSPGQCLDCLFMALGFASLVSVYLAFHQLLHFANLEDLAMRMNSARPGANLAQPNQLATLFLLGMLGAGWGYLRKQLSAPVAIGLACLFLLGESVTLSRTGWLNLVILLSALTWWGLWSKSVKKVVIAVALGIFFVICLVGVPHLTSTLLFENNQITDDRFLSGLRPLAWRVFIDASQRELLWGYGWGQLQIAQFRVSNDHPNLGAMFNQSHNLFLDFILWNGVLIGALVTAAIIWWFITSVRRVRNPSDAISILFLTVMGVHAMLEYPLHYAYFLLPTGMVIGQCSTRLRFTPAATTRSWSAIVVLVLASGVLGITIRDYFKVETSFYALLFEKAHVGKATNGQPPDVLVLTQMREMIRFARVEPNAKFALKELDWMRQVVETTPSNYGINKLATALAYNGQPQQARLWLQRLCKTSPEEQCANTKKTWTALTQSAPYYAAVDWPENRTDKH